MLDENSSIHWHLLVRQPHLAVDAIGYKGLFIAKSTGEDPVGYDWKYPVMRTCGKVPTLYNALKPKKSYRKAITTNTAIW